MAAILGNRFSLDELAALLDRPLSALLDPFREVVAAGMLVEDAGLLIFRHALVRETIEAGLPLAVKDSLRRFEFLGTLPAARRHSVGD
jgi:hypothetical protein